jgi:glycerol-3-phosphate dehydrogenase
VAVTYADACDLKLPIFRTVASVLSGEMTLEEAENHLMGLPLTNERVVK